MSDPMVAAGGPALGLADYLDKKAANENARKFNATSSKWAPLLALNHSKGAGTIDVPSASFVRSMGPAIIAGLNGAKSSRGGDSGSVADISGMDSSGAQAIAGGQGEGGGFDPTELFGGASMMAASGGMVPKYSNGGGISSMASSLVSLLPMLAMLAPGGGMVPGKEKMPGDSPINDTKLVAASPGEVVVPKSVVNDPNKWKVAAYLSEVKKHGPGPMPIRGHQSSGKKTSNSMSPWAAMCSGGMR